MGHWICIGTHAMSEPVGNAGDHNLLFGILALQMDFISRDALIKAMNADFREAKLGDISPP